MHSRWFDVAVVLLWLTTMGWLISAKVLPALRVGDPPDSRTILDAKQGETVVGWRMSWDGRAMGWALNTTVPLAHGMTQLRSLVHFDEIPISESARKFLANWLGAEFSTQVQLEFDSVLDFDAFGRLSRFESALRFLPSQPQDAAIKVRGQIDGSQLNLTLRTGDYNEERQLKVPGKGMLGDAVSPQTCLPGLRQGQSWTIEVYSPLHSADRPLEIIHATVEAKQPVSWEGRAAEAWVVVYRPDTGTAADRAGKPQGRLWVLPEGKVIRQQVIFFGSAIDFDRMSDVEAAALERTTGLRRRDAVNREPEP